MEQLRRLGLVEVLREYTRSGRPFLGVCLGLQLLFAESEEHGGERCLGVLPGRVRRLPEGVKVPHMGWNAVNVRGTHPVFEGVPDGSYFYFVHSYYVEPADQSIILGVTDHGVAFTSAIARDNLVATQFHPEKSARLGLRIYDNFARWASTPAGELRQSIAAPAGRAAIRG
jgi:glutamine amidotransferase